MHKKLYILLVIFMALLSCDKNRIDDPEFGEGDYPRIFDISNAFTTPTMIINAGDTVKYSGLLFSPVGKVKVAWKVDGEVKSTDTVFDFSPAAGGEYTVELEAEFNGLKSYRSKKILVSPDTYTPAPYTNVVMAYLSATGTVLNLNFDNLTHVAFQSARVSSDGSLDVSAGEIDQRMDEIAARAHIAGKPVLLGVTGRLSGLDGWAIYEANDFGQAISNAGTRAILVANVAAYVVANKLDGVDIMMSDVNSSIAVANIAAIGPFMTELKAALPAGAMITVTVSPGWQHSVYPDLSAADWVNVRAFEDGLHVGPAAPRAQSSTYDYMVAGAEIWATHLPANKLVIGIPAFGMRYNEIDGDGNNLSWGSYEYLAYNTILGLDPAAADKELVNSNHGVYYNGKPLVKQKSDYLKANGYKGAYLWAVDYDSMDDKALLKVISDALK